MLVGYGDDGRGRARLLHGRPGRGHLGPPPRAVDAGPASRPSVARRADHGAREPRRLPALQGRRRASSGIRRDTARRCSSTRRSSSGRSPQETTRAFNALTLHYNLFVDRRARRGVAAGARAEREARARDQSHLPAARPDPLARGHRRGADRADASPTRACGRARIEYLDNLLDRRRAQARDAARRGHAGRRAHPQGQRDLPDARRATSRTRSRSCCTTRIS